MEVEDSVQPIQQASHHPKSHDTTGGGSVSHLWVYNWSNTIPTGVTLLVEDQSHYSEFVLYFL